jgi:hypothetical protein
MEVTANITRTDLARYQLMMIVMNYSNLFFMFFLFLGLALYLWFFEILGIHADALSIITIAAIGSIFSVVMATLLGLPMAYLWPKPLGGGQHVFRINDAGLNVKTEHKNCSTGWPDILRVIRTRDYIFIQVEMCQYQLIPRRDFASQEDYMEFWATARGFWQEAAESERARERMPRD